MNVRVEDINFVDETILFRHMKTRKPITVPLSKTLKVVLREYVQTMGLHKEDLLFPKLNGEIMIYDTLHQNIKIFLTAKRLNFMELIHLEIRLPL